MAIPSVTVIVVNSLGVPPSFETPSLTLFDCLIREILHGADSFQHVATPTNGLSISSSSKPIA